MNDSSHGIITIFGPRGKMSVDMDKILSQKTDNVPLHKEAELLCIASPSWNDKSYAAHSYMWQ